jgi:hypothetical protein
VVELKYYEIIAKPHEAASCAYKKRFVNPAVNACVNKGFIEVHSFHIEVWPELLNTMTSCITTFANYFSR